MLHFIGSIVLGLCVAATNAAYPPPEPLSGTLPGSINSTLDPGLIRRASDGKLFLYTTPEDLTVFTASSLHGPWSKEVKTALYNHDDLGRGNHGAPHMYHIGDTYYLFFNGHRADAPDAAHDGLIGVATSPTLEVGSWNVHGYLDIAPRWKYNILDATLLVKNTSDSHSQHLLGFGSYQQGIFTIPMASPPTTIARNANNEISHLAYNGTANNLLDKSDVEGSYLFEHEGFYYLFFSSGECCKRSGEAGLPSTQWKWGNAGQVYKVMVCRSDSPTGGFVDRQGRNCITESGGTEVLASHDSIWAPGGQGVMFDKEIDGVVMYYHYGQYLPRVHIPDRLVNILISTVWTKGQHRRAIQVRMEQA